MKRILIASILGIAVSAAHSRGSGTVDFNTYCSSSCQFASYNPVLWGDNVGGHTAGQPIDYGSGFSAELLYGLGSGLSFTQLIPIPSSVTRVGALFPGLILAGPVTLPDWEPGDPVTFAIVAFNGTNYATSTYRSLSEATWTEPASTIAPVGLPSNDFTASLILAAYPKGLPVYAVSGPNCPPHPASAQAVVAGGHVVGANILDGGCGYTNAPLVLFQGGGGIGAAATTTISDGIVTQITITGIGNGYSGTPTIVIGSAPVIGSQPQSLTVPHGNNALFTVTDLEFTPASFQWSFCGTNIPGATSSTLTVSNVDQSDLGAYAVAITNFFGSVTSSNATLSMYPFLDVPFDGAVTHWGTNASFTVEASGSGPLNYQWFFNGESIQDATNSTFSFAEIQFTNAGLYSVLVSNPFGSVTNSPEQVVVNPAGVSFGLCPLVVISGTVGYNYVIRRTADLSNTNSWVTVAGVTLITPVQLWVDTNINTTLPGNPHNYYEVLPGQ